jgi:protein TonB
MKKIVFVIVTFLSLAALSEVKAQVSPKPLIISQYYEGGQDSLYAFINKNKVYPIVAKKNRIQGECLIHVKFNESGIVTSATILKTIGGGCADEAVKVVKLLKFKSPGWAIEGDIPVYFSLK